MLRRLFFRRTPDYAVYDEPEIIAMRILVALRMYYARCDRVRGDESQRIFKHRGASIPGIGPDDEGRIEVIAEVLRHA